MDYSKLEKSVRESFNFARNLGMNHSESIGWSIDDLWRIAENSELEHLIVYLVLGKILQEKNPDLKGLVKEELTKHYEAKTPLRYKGELQPEDYVLIVKDLENVIGNWI